MPAEERPFWERKPLEALTRSEWESLCDGCGKCCMHKLQDEDTGRLYYTNVACRLLDADTCRCTDYPRRSRRVHDCLNVTLESLDDPAWLPRTCAYRLLAEGRALPRWHPLVCGDHHQVHEGGHSVRGRVVPEDEAEDLECHLIDWIR